MSATVSYTHLDVYKRQDLGSALPLRDERRARIRGRDMVTNLSLIHI